MVSESEAETPETLLAVCLVAMRHLIDRDVATKAGISRGGFGDVFGCYPPAIQEAAEDHRYVPLGENGDHGLIWLGQNKWGLENVANLGLLPPKGAIIVVGSPKIAGCTGGPSRVLALL